MDIIRYAEWDLQQSFLEEGNKKKNQKYSFQKEKPIFHRNIIKESQTCH